MDSSRVRVVTLYRWNLECSSENCIGGLWGAGVSGVGYSGFFLVSFLRCRFLGEFCLGFWVRSRVLLFFRVLIVICFVLDVFDSWVFLIF